MSEIRITVKGINELKNALAGVPAMFDSTVEAAGAEIGRTILETEGLRRYPPPGSANRPPTPYYVRGSGMQYVRGNSGSSERLGTQYYVETQETTITIGNRASYAGWVSGEEQASFMAPKGWRKLFDVAKENIGEIVRIYEGWVARGLKQLGL